MSNLLSVGDGSVLAVDGAASGATAWAENNDAHHAGRHVLMRNNIIFI